MNAPEHLFRAGVGDRADGGLSPGERVAVIGSGIAGLATAWLLADHARVTVFEAGPEAGGHTHTVDVTLGSVSHPVDTGFLVFNRRTYPNLCALFATLGVEAVETEMSFGVSLAEPGIEWAGTDLASVFAQPRNLVRPAFHGMLRDIMRFNRDTTQMARAGQLPQLSLGDFLVLEDYSDAFRDWYLLPMAAAIWSCPTSTMLDYPLATFVRFCHNHGLLQIFDRPQWLTVKNGGRSYVRRMLQKIDDLRLNSPVTMVSRDETGVWVSSSQGTERFDCIVFACHSDQALAILGTQASAEERRVLGAVRYQDNVALLHTDANLLPARRKVWSAWNYLAGKGEPDTRPVSVSYLINRLQPLPFETPVVVSLNPFREPAPERLIKRITYAHPVFDHGAIDAQNRLPRIQGRNRSWFAGAWTGYGFHEDGLRSAMAVAESMGVAVPWREAVAGAVEADRTW
ncbi:NAD(P)/FAD-dependent oxidoreductase [Thauera humireducens]|uniref:NAD(P)/FAD-dependent oxidoreductase n=1 Tax=Thauera humireducens TaxID=1134435 RepID=UPI000B2066AC|nr:FAD-dependent oxidoreductase [Thauera humireducens]